jgi:small subunit ribosomal protein S5
MSAVEPITKSDGYQERAVGKPRRYSKTTKGGRILKYGVSVVVGDGEGGVGFGKRSAREVAVAMPKALERARRDMLHIQLHDGTIYHRVEATYGATKVIILPAKSTGIIAGGPMRAVFEVIGIKHIVSKIIGSRNPVNVLRATLKALEQINTPEAMREKRKKQPAHNDNE